MFVHILLRLTEKDPYTGEWYEDRGIVIDVFENHSDAVRDMRFLEEESPSHEYNVYKKRLF